MDFSKCSTCGKIFKRESEEKDCPSCRQEPAAPPSDKEYLRLVRNLIKDAMASGEMLTVPQIIEKTSVPESKVWHFIASGEIDTASFRDPEVQRFIQKQRLERLRKLGGDDDAKVADEPAAEKPRGFHTRDIDERRR